MAMAMDGAALTDFLEREFPEVSGEFTILKVEPEIITVQLNTSARHLRPGVTVSGPSMFGLADVTMYLAVLAQIGPVALAVTTNCSIDFMRKPAAGVPVVAEGRVLKLGRTLAVGDVLLRSGENGPIVARASLTYAIPPKNDGVK